MLENSVSLVAKLNSVKDISNQLVASGNPPLEYEAYCDLLISASNQLDKLNQVPTNRASVMLTKPILVIFVLKKTIMDMVT